MKDNTEKEPVAKPDLSSSPEGIAAMAMRRFRIAGDAVNRATADLPDHQRSLIRWLHAYASENDLALADVARFIRYDESTVHRVFHGKYEGNLANVVKEIEAAKRLYEQRQAGRKLDFVETSLSRRIYRMCDIALEFQRIAYLFGESQIGKTTNLRRFQQARNHGSVVYVRMPTGGTMGFFLAALAEALRISPQQKERELRRRIISAFDDRMLLIVDECHQALMGRRTYCNPLEFVRELHDATGCGVVLAGTNVFRSEVEGGTLSALMRQSRRRRVISIQLPDSPTRADLDTFAAAYGLKPATGEAEKLQAQVIREEALGMWLTLLRMATKLATRRDEKLTWEHVLKADAGRRALESGQA